jgi:hypothetical protein
MHAVQAKQIKELIFTARTKRGCIVWWWQLRFKIDSHQKVHHQDIFLFDIKLNTTKEREVEICVVWCFSSLWCSRISYGFSSRLVRLYIYFYVLSFGSFCLLIWNFRIYFVLMRAQCRIEAQTRCLVVRRSVSL